MLNFKIQKPKDAYFPTPMTTCSNTIMTQSVVYVDQFSAYRVFFLRGRSQMISRILT